MMTRISSGHRFVDPALVGMPLRIATGPEHLRGLLFVPALELGIADLTTTLSVAPAGKSADLNDSPCLVRKSLARSQSEYLVNGVTNMWKRSPSPRQ